MSCWAGRLDDVSEYMDSPRCRFGPTQAFSRVSVFAEHANFAENVFEEAEPGPLGHPPG